MRRARAIGSAILALVSGTAAIACVDLFHSTDFETSCDVDASACATLDGAAADVTVLDASDGAVDFCAWDSTTARAHAEHACAWLSACEGPLGDNAFGPCMFHALLAYDCAINPDLRVRGDLRAFWDRLWRVESCADVSAIVEPAGKHPCAPSSSDFAQCSSEADGAAANAASVTACAASSGTHSPAGVESCVAGGRTCATVGTMGSCSGTSPASCAGGNVVCEGGRHVIDCDDGGAIDHGVDCQYFGAGTCSARGCTTTYDGGTAACPANGADVTCDSKGVASSCPSGTLARVDCASLLGASFACDPSAPGRSWDVARACSVGACASSDTCTAGDVHTCFHGATFTAHCASQGLGACALLTMPSDGGTMAACQSP